MKMIEWDIATIVSSSRSMVAFRRNCKMWIRNSGTFYSRCQRGVCVCVCVEAITREKLKACALDTMSRYQSHIVDRTAPRTYSTASTDCGARGCIGTQKRLSWEEEVAETQQPNDLLFLSFLCFDICVFGVALFIRWTSYTISQRSKWQKNIVYRIIPGVFGNVAIQINQIRSFSVTLFAVQSQPTLLSPFTFS